MGLALPLRATGTQPKSYWLSQPYHNGTSYNPGAHHAIDMVGYYNQPVYAAQSGRVFAAEWNGRGWAYGGGYTIIIDHFSPKARLKTVYAHLARVVVVRDQYVMKGQLIGYADSSGNSTGHHLHFSVGRAKDNYTYYYSYTWLDPRRYFNAHTFANGSQAKGNLFGSSTGKNTFRVNTGVNMRSRPSLSSDIVRTTTSRSKTCWLARVNGTSWNGSSAWFKVWDPQKRRICYVHSSLGTYV